MALAYKLRAEAFWARFRSISCTFAERRDFYCSLAGHLSMQNDWLVWQLIDSAFPTGGFAHSGGLEAALQHGMILDEAALDQFLRISLQQTRRGVLCFALDAHASPDTFALIDQRCDVFLNNHVANRASRAQGRALLASAAKAFEHAKVAELAASVRDQRSPGHLAPAFGIVAESLRISAAQAGEMFLFMTVRGVLSSAVRLGIVGPIQAQQMQAALAKEPVSIPGNQTPVQTSPLLDLIQATHERLYSKLFQS
jgi:urease accessory protein